MKVLQRSLDIVNVVEIFIRVLIFDRGVPCEPGLLSLAKILLAQVQEPLCVVFVIEVISHMLLLLPHAPVVARILLDGVI